MGVLLRLPVLHDAPAAPDEPASATAAVPTRDSSRSRRKHPARAQTINMDRYPLRRLREETALLAAEMPWLDDLRDERPRTRGDCIGHDGPCPWISCRHHLYLDVVGHDGSIKVHFPDVSPEDLDRLPATCALDVADEQHGATLEQVGEILNVTRERARQLEERALRRLHMRRLDGVVRTLAELDQ